VSELAPWESDSTVEQAPWETNVPGPKPRTLLQSLNPLNNPLVAGAYGLGESATTMATGLGAAAYGGLKGLNAWAAPGGTHEDATKAIQEAQQKYTYQPRTEQGQTVNHAIEAVVAPVRAGSGYVGKVLGQSLSGEAPTSEKSQLWGERGQAIGEIAPDIAMTVAGARPLLKTMVERPNFVERGPTTTQIEGSRQNATTLDALRNAETHGFTVPAFASRLNPTIRERLGGMQTITRDAVTQNQQVGNMGMLRNVLGDSEHSQLTPQAFAAAEERAMAPRHEIEQLGEIPLDDTFHRSVNNLDDLSGLSSHAAALIEQAPEARAKVQRLRDITRDMDTITGDEAMRVMSDLRRQSSDVLFGGQQVTQADRAIARAQRRLSDALETNIERRLEAIGNTDLLNRFREGRTQYAQIQDLKGATNRATGNVDMSILGNAAAEGDHLTGYLGTVANIAAHKPEFFQSVDRLSNIPHSSYHSAGNYAARGIMGSLMGPAGYAAASSGNLLSAAAMRGHVLSPKFIAKNRMQDYRPLRESMGNPNVEPPPLELAPQGPLPPSPMGGTVIGTGPNEGGILGLSPQLGSQLPSDGAGPQAALRSGVRQPSQQSAPQMPAVEYPLQAERVQAALEEMHRSASQDEFLLAWDKYEQLQDKFEGMPQHPAAERLYNPVLQDAIIKSRALRDFNK